MVSKKWFVFVVVVFYPKLVCTYFGETGRSKWGMYLRALVVAHLRPWVMHKLAVVAPLITKKKHSSFDV